MSKAPIHHPSSIWDWYKEGKRHSCGSVAFVAWPDHVASLADLSLTIRQQNEEIRLLREQLEKALIGLHDDSGKVIHEELPRINAEIEAAKGKIE